MENVQEKKGLSPLAWVGIGCGAIVLIGIIMVVAGGLFVAHKAKDVVGDFKSNPELAAARMIVRLNPEIEEVSSDEKAGTITVRDKKTGKTMTASFADIKEGKFSLTDEDGKTMTFESQSEDEGGSMRMTSDEGTFEMNTGSQSGEVPDWVPVPESVEAFDHFKMKTDEFENGGFSARSDNTVNEIMEFYKKSLDENGFQVSTHVSTLDGKETAAVNGIIESTGKSVTVAIGTDDDVTRINVSYSKKLSQ